MEESTLIENVTTVSGRRGVVPAVGFFSGGGGPLTELARSMSARCYLAHGDQIMVLEADADAASETVETGQKPPPGPSSSASQQKGAAAGASALAAGSEDVADRRRKLRWVAVNRKATRDDQPRYAILIRNKKTNTGTLVGCGPAFHFRPVVEPQSASSADNAAGDKAAAAEGDGDDADAAAANDEPTAQDLFGSKKRRRELKSFANDKIGDQTNIVGEHSQLLSLASSSQQQQKEPAAASLSTDQQLRSAVATLPPYDDQATDRRHVYRMENVIPSKLEEAISPLVEPLIEALGNKDALVALHRDTGLPLTAVRRLVQLHDERAKSNERRIRRIVSYVAVLSQLILFSRCPTSALTVDKCAKRFVNPDVAEQLLDLFAQPKSRPSASVGEQTSLFKRAPPMYVRPKVLVDKLLNYICVTALTTTKLQATAGSIALLRHDLGLTSDQMNQHFRAVGCKSRTQTADDSSTEKPWMTVAVSLAPENTVSVGNFKMVLSAPLKLPERRPIRAKRKRD